MGVVVSSLLHCQLRFRHCCFALFKDLRAMSVVRSMCGQFGAVATVPAG